MTKDPDRNAHLALVLPGGGARAAYQAGVLRGLGRQFPGLCFPLVTGVSAGAINATFLAAHPGNFDEAADDLAAVWEKIEFDDVFRIDLGSLMRNAFKWLASLALGGSKLAPSVQGLLDTRPLRELMERELQVSNKGGHDGRIEGIARNIEMGRLRALALLTVNYGTGQTVVWVEGSDVEAWQRPSRRSVSTELTVDHVMASSALPLAFPAIPLAGGWFGDGGIRLAAPFSPALHLGAERILAISIRYPRSHAEADETALTGYPPPAQIAGNLMNAIFLDVLDQDVLRLERLNRILAKLPPEEREGLKPVDIQVLRPSQDLGKLAAGFESALPRGLRFLTRGLGTRETKSPDYLSLLMFHSGYLRRLVELGEKDVAAKADELAAWMGV
jgi:NTE family protein